MKILLVDDDAGSLRGMQLAVKMLAHSCDSYNDPCEALNQYRTNRYDLVITDIYMPMMNGLTMGTMIRRHNPEAKIIFISGQLNKTLEAMAEQDQTGVFLRKPIEFRQLQEAIDQISNHLEEKTL